MTIDMPYGWTPQPKTNIDPSLHATLDDIKKEFIQNGFKLESCDFNKRPFNDSSTYLAFLKLSKS